MIVHDEETLEEALQLLESQGPLHYSDEYAYIIITTPETLELQCRRAFGRNDIAVVVPRGEESAMEDYTKMRVIIRKRRSEEEKRRVREWVKEHPEIAKASAEEVPQIIKRMRKERRSSTKEEVVE